MREHADKTSSVPTQPTTPEAVFDVGSSRFPPATALDIYKAHYLPTVSGVDTDPSLSICEFEVSLTQLGNCQPPNPNPHP